MPAVGKRLIRIKVGETIKADFLNESVDSINELVDWIVAPPAQINPADDPDLQNAKNQDDAGGDSADVFVEVERTFEEVIVFDQDDENYATIERIVTIHLQDGNGNNLKMRINN